MLVVRPGDALSLSPTYRFEIPRHSGASLPAGLLRLAGAVKLTTRHRVVVHDARQDEDGNRSLRGLAKLLEPDLSVVWLHPASLEGGLEAARALRQSGTGVLVGTGPLVDLWPEGACRIPELDGLLAQLSPLGLCAALDVLASGGSGGAVVQALSDRKREVSLGEPLERKLLDYAVYDRSADGLWPFVLGSQGGPLARLAARGRSLRKPPAVSAVLLRDLRGELVEATDLVADLRSCALLGIDWLDLCTAPGEPGPDTDFFVRLCSLLARHRSSFSRTQQLRLELGAAQLSELGLQRVQAAGIRAINLGSINSGDREGLGVAIRMARACLAVGIEPSGVLLLGCSGYDLEEDRKGVSEAIRAGFPLSAGIDVRLGSVDVGRWTDWLDAPSSDFKPPGLEPERIVLADRARLALEQARSTQGGLRTAARQLFFA